jgi:hypothetical protein
MTIEEIRAEYNRQPTREELIIALRKLIECAKQLG